MNVCPSCGAEVADQARFCSNCGSALGGPGRAPGEERRFVTIVFVDLVGFTERSDAADPEDVRTVLIPYHARAKEIIEAHGGTLDKFIGDAVMGVFGAPVAHEDDPERAVRAAIRILDAVGELRAMDPLIQVRVAVNSGEAVVAPGTGPQIGEAVAGDVVNTASRMQSLAPPGGVLVGEVTQRLVRHAFDALEQPAATVKGKAQPLRTWLVVAERAGAHERAAPTSPAFVGREDEVGLMLALLSDAARDGRLHVATVIGEPGIGKSRLIEEVRSRGGPEGTWLQSGCAPYGETFALEPLARVLREVAGIGPADPPDVALELLGTLAVRIVGEPGPAEGGAGWLRSRLTAILGLTDEPGPRDISMSEMADALARALRWRISGGTAVICVHDLHWAHDSLLDLLAGLARRLSQEPVLVVATTRPGLEHRPQRWPPEGVPFTRLALDPLDAADTERLIDSIMPPSAAERSVAERLSYRSGGNPLYAVEFARMLADREAAGDPARAMPRTVQAVVAARLDSIPADLRALVQAASVAGSECWPDLLGQLSGRGEAAAAAGLEALRARDFVRPAVSTLAGHRAYAFVHDVVREVAYERIPRARRGRDHLDVARWLEAHAGDRADEFAEALAGHLFNAVSLGRAAGDAALAGDAQPGAVRWTLVTARRAMRADPGEALALFERAADLAPDESSERVDALLGAGVAGRRSGRLPARETLARYESALSIARAGGNRAGAGRALVRVGSQLGAMGEIARSREALNEAVRTLEGVGGGRDLASAYAYRAEDAMYAGRNDDALADAGRALDLLRTVEGAFDLVVMALHIRGDGRCARGERDGLTDLERALELSVREESTADIITSQTYVADWRWEYDGPAESLRHTEDAMALADLRGSVSQGLWSKAGALPKLLELGEWDRVIGLADSVLSVGRTDLDAALWVTSQSLRARALLELGRAAEALPITELMAAAEEQRDDVQAASHGYLGTGALAAEIGDGRAVETAMRRFESVTADAPPEYREAELAAAVRVCVRGGALETAERLIAASHSAVPHHTCTRLSASAIMAEARGERAEAARAYTEAAAAWLAFGIEREARLAEEGLTRTRAAP